MRKYRLEGQYDDWGMVDAETGDSAENDTDTEWVKADDAQSEILRIWRGIPSEIDEESRKIAAWVRKYAGELSQEAYKELRPILDRILTDY